MEYFLSSIFGLYTHYFFIFLLISQFLFMLGRFVYQLYINRRNNSVLFRKVLVNLLLFFFQFCILQAISFSFLIPWLLYVYSLGSAANTQPQIPPPTGYSLLQAFSLFLFGFQPQGLQSIFISFWPLVVMLFLFIFTQRREKSMPEINYIVTVTFLPVVLVFLISFFRPIFLVRYLILVTPTLFFLLSWFLMNYSKKLSLYLSSFLIIVLVGLLLSQNLSAQTPAKENYKQATDYLEIHAKPQDIIVVSAPFTIYPVEYSYNGQSKIETIPEWNRFSGSGIAPFNEDALIQQIERYKRQYHSMYVILSYDQGYQDELVGYLDNNLERLDLQQLSEDLEIRVYRLKYDIPENIP
jgi:mannosyltransferase